MRYYWVILILLIACSPSAEPQPAPVIPEPQPAIIEKPLPPAAQPPGETAVHGVKQTGSLGTFAYGLSDDNRVLHIEKTGALWEYEYSNGRLIGISGPENIEFFYDQGKLARIDLGSSNLVLSYDNAGRLLNVEGGRENLHMEYDSANHLRSVKRGVAGETLIDYDKQDKVKYLTRGLVTTDVEFDDKNRVRNFDGGDTNFILGYWRDDKMISLTGKTFGTGLTISYGSGHPPFEAKFIHADDDSVFNSGNTEALYKVVDEYTYCKFIRRLPGVLFDGISYTYYTNYFGGDIVDYIKMQFACVPYEA